MIGWLLLSGIFKADGEIPRVTVIVYVLLGLHAGPSIVNGLILPGQARYCGR